MGAESDSEDMSAQTDYGWVPEDSLANRLVLVRRHLGITQRVAAERSGLTFGEWQGLEDGRQVRGLDVKVTAISRTLGVDRDWLIWGGPLAEASLPSRDLTGAAKKRTAPGHQKPRKAATSRQSHAVTGTEGAAGFRCTSQPQRQLRGREVSRPYRHHSSPRARACPLKRGRTAERYSVRLVAVASPERVRSAGVDAA